MELVGVLFGAVSFGAVMADWLNRREMMGHVKQTADEMNKVLERISEVHNKQTIEVAALAERLAQSEIRMATIGIAKAPFGRQ